MDVLVAVAMARQDNQAVVKTEHSRASCAAYSAQQPMKISLHLGLLSVQLLIALACGSLRWRSHRIGPLSLKWL